MNRIERVTPTNPEQNQSELFEDTFLKNLKGLQAKIVKQQHVPPQSETATQYIGDSTRKLVELKLMELESVISARQKEQEWIQKREIRSAQCDRLQQARNNLQMLIQLEEKGKVGIEDDIENCIKILQEVQNIGGDDIVVAKTDTVESVIDSFHLTQKDLKRAFGKTNILDVMRNAKENGWTMTISNDEVALYKDGVRIEHGKAGKTSGFVSAEDRKNLNKSSHKITKMSAKSKKTTKGKRK